MDTLFLILKKKYFEQILSGEKTEEFRIVKPFWVKKIIGRQYSHIIFQNGYSKKSPRIKAEYIGYDIRVIKHEVFGGEEEVIFALKLGGVKKIR